MGKVCAGVQGHIDDAGATDPNRWIVRSRDTSALKGEHLFAVTKDGPGEKMTRPSGDDVTRVCQGPYSQTKDLHDELKTMSATRGNTGGDVRFFCTTCPNGAEAYGTNHVLGPAQV